MIKYPMHFEVKAKAPSGVQTPFEASGEDFPPIMCAVPKEFNGPGGGYSPEELFAMAVMSCLIATFKVFAEKTKFSFGEISGFAKLIIDRNAQGVPELQKLEMNFTLTGVQDQTKAKSLLAEAEKFCLVSNAIKTEKSFNYKFE